jgi:hypothetical protein
MKRLVGIATQKPKAHKKLKGFVMYDGVSILDGAPIVVIATLETSNTKTGDMVQVWIVRSDMSPIEAYKLGNDESVCGNCMHRWHNGGACYVNIGQAPLSIYRAYKAGKYPKYSQAEHEHYLEHRKVRLGAYGDPAAAPFEIMQYLANVGIGHTGYTHQARHKNFDERFLSICMVSADSPKQAQQWQDKGARTFRVAMVGDAMHDSEIECLSDSKGLTCLDCGLCDGNKRTNKSIVIAVHGTRQSKFKTSTLIPLVNV